MFTFLYLLLCCSVLLSEELELTPAPPQTPGCQLHSISVAVADAIEPTQSCASPETELQSQVGKSMTLSLPAASRIWVRNSRSQR